MINPFSLLPEIENKIRAKAKPGTVFNVSLGVKLDDFNSDPTVLDRAIDEVLKSPIDDRVLSATMNSSVLSVQLGSLVPFRDMPGHLYYTITGRVE